jgi:hypothetical protein
MKRKQKQSRCGGEPAALGNRRTDDTYSHAGTDGGLPVKDEYRGYLLDVGLGLILSTMVTPARELLQINLGQKYGEPQ